MNDHDLSFIANYSKIRTHLREHGKTVEIEPKSPKVVIRRHVHDRLIKEMERQAADRKIVEAASRLIAKPKWQVILDEVAAEHGLKVREILGKSRSTSIVLARHEAMWRMYLETAMSMPDVGRRMKRHHTTVLHGIRTHARRNGLPVTRGGADA